MSDGPTLPPGSYLDAERNRYVLPHEPCWSAVQFASAAEEPLPSCPCGSSADVLIFTTVQPLSDAAKQLTKKETTNITGLCMGCAERAGMAVQAAASGAGGG